MFASNHVRKPTSQYLQLAEVQASNVESLPAQTVKQTVKQSAKPSTSLKPTQLPQNSQPIAPPPPSIKVADPISAPDLFDWRKLDSLRLLVQISLTFMLLVFCLSRMTSEKDDKALYWGGIMSIVAWWMPSPGSGTSLQSKK